MRKVVLSPQSWCITHFCVDIPHNLPRSIMTDVLLKLCSQWIHCVHFSFNKIMSRSTSGKAIHASVGSFKRGSNLFHQSCNFATIILFLHNNQLAFLALSASDKEQSLT